MINTVIFDMDGVIVNTEPLHQESFFQHYKELGLHISKEEHDTFRGLSTKNLYQKLKENYPIDDSIEDLVNKKREIFYHIFDNKENLDLLPGMKNLIELLYKEKFQLILATSSARVTLTRIFNRFGLFPYFTHIVSGEDFPQSKPNPAIFLEAVRISGNPKEKCIIIEDSTNGVKAANAAGVFCVGYKNRASGKQDLSTADTVITDFSQLSIDRIKNFALAK